MCWMKIKKASLYAGVSPRTLRDWLKNDLKHSRMPSGLILVKSEWIDEYIEQFSSQDNQIEKIVESVMRDFSNVKGNK
jgi:hypothetical protein